MNALLDRLAALDEGRVVASAVAALGLLLVVAWAVAAATGRWTVAGLLAAGVVAVLAVIGLLYAFELGSPSASA